MRLPDNVYDILKRLCVLGIPALSTLYSSLAAIWGWPFSEQIPATLSAVSLCLGCLIGVSEAEYNKRLGGGASDDA